MADFYLGKLTSLCTLIFSSFTSPDCKTTTVCWVLVGVHQAAAMPFNLG
jgi:hypothetical protein